MHFASLHNQTLLHKRLQGGRIVAGIILYAELIENGGLGFRQVSEGLHRFRSSSTSINVAKTKIRIALSSISADPVTEGRQLLTRF